jgi:quinolinate synthase
MKRITLERILHSLETMTEEVTVDPVIAARARQSIEAMLRVGAPVKKQAA